MLKTKRIESGSWRTVEWFWNAGGLARFRAPNGAKIKVRYGIGWLGFDRQNQTLNGVDIKVLKVGSVGSLGRARMQVRVSQTIDVTYDVYPAGTPVPIPEIPF